MKLKGHETARYLARPDPNRPALLICGADPMRVAMKRVEALAALTGPKADEEMRLTRLSGADLRRDPATLLDAVKAVGFFPGPRAVFVEEATDGVAPVFREALAAWAPGDAVMLATAGALGKASALRKLFEAHPAAVIATLYDDPPGEAEVLAWLAAAGLPEVPRDALRELGLLARALDPGDLRQTIEKIGLYKHGDPAPLTPAEIALLAPATIEAEIDEIIESAAEGRADRLVLLMQRLAGSGTAPVSLAIAATRHFRALHAAASDPEGPAAGLARLRPPVFGPRRDRMARQAREWGVARLEEALHLLVETDLALRSGGRAPAMAVMERALIRLAMRARG